MLLIRTVLGAAPLLDDMQQANLWQALKGSAPDGGLWNGRKVADYLSELISQPISRQQGWEYLKQMRMRLRVPRPSHCEADLESQETWKKKLQQEVERIQTEHPNAAVEVWSEDEHRIGLNPIVRRIWVEQGEQPTAKVNCKREWLWLYAFVQPQSGETYWWILPQYGSDKKHTYVEWTLVTRGWGDKGKERSLYPNTVQLRNVVETVLNKNQKSNPGLRLPTPPLFVIYR
jgi:hypothetical protein